MPRVARPGFELEKILAAHWIVPDASGNYTEEQVKARRTVLGKEGEGCKCLEHAREMDRNGPDWCEQNISTIVGWMKEEARRRGWKMFSSMYAKRLVKQAIKNSREAMAAWEARTIGGARS